MPKLARRFGVFPSAHEDARSARLHADCPQTASPSYRLAFQDADFLLREELRPVRLQLELLKPELVLQEQGIEATVVVYGSARLQDPESAAVRLEKVLEALKKAPDDLVLRQELVRARTAVTSAAMVSPANASVSR